MSGEDKIRIASIRNLINRYGVKFKNFRGAENSFGERGIPVEICSGKGIFHREKKFIDETLKESGRVKKQKVDMFFVEMADIKAGDEIEFLGHRYRVLDAEDVGEMGYWLDLSFERIS